MPANYAQHIQSKVTSQSAPIPGREASMSRNTAGGFSFVLDDWGRLDRFLILGCDKGTYYASEKTLTKENAACVLRCYTEDQIRTIDRIKEISKSGRAPKNDAAIFALALGAAYVGEHADWVRAPALSVLSEVCRTGTHLLQFVAAVDQLRGWGRGLKTEVANWYLNKDPRSLAFQMMKYQQRNSWSQRDVLRLAHPNPTNYGAVSTVLHWVTKGWDSVGETPHENPDLVQLWAFERAKRATTLQQITSLITNYNLPRECVPTQWLKEPAVWDALLPHMPMTAMIRNLANMTRCGLIAPFSTGMKFVVDELGNVEHLRRARVHPITLLAALKTYASGRSEKGSNTWTAVQQVSDALDKAFYAAFSNVEPTNQNWLLALDVSGSMAGSMIAGIPNLSAREAVAAMSLVTAATEPSHHIIGFTGRGGWDNPGVGPLSISVQGGLYGAMQATSNLPFSRTDCALPALYAAEKKLPVDVIVIYTDNETWCGTIHPAQALVQLRQTLGKPVKQIVVGTTATEFTVADQSDPLSLDVVGFDTNVPGLMSSFVGSSPQQEVA